MEQKEKKSFDYQLLARIIGLAAPYKKLFGLTIFLAIVLAPVSMLRPFLISVMVDEYILVNNAPLNEFNAVQQHLVDDSAYADAADAGATATPNIRSNDAT